MLDNKLRPKRNNKKLWRYRNNPRCDKFGNSQFMYRRFYNQKQLEYKHRTGQLIGKRLESGFYEGQTYGGLYRAWLAYIISDKNDDYDRKKYYAAVIQKLEGELKLQKYPFEEIREAVAEYLTDNYQSSPELNDMSVEEIEQLMKKSDDEFWREVNR